MSILNPPLLNPPLPTLRRASALVLGGLTFLSVNTAFAAPSQNAFTHVPDAAIPGHNVEHHAAVNVADCASACVATNWCVSFDYYKNSFECDLSDVRAEDVGGLKTTYNNNPYDHYSLHGSGLQEFRQSQSAAVFGHNVEQLTGVSREDCAQACTDPNRSSWCVSFDYYKNLNTCDLSDVRAEDVGGLETNYNNDPYDHYSLREPSLALFSPRYFTALSGYNTEHLVGVSPSECSAACTDVSRRDWCVSFDYYRDTNECDLSDARTEDVGSLYTTASYDHYSLEVPYAPINGDKHVLVIGIDGLRGDAIQCPGCADTPNLDLLIQGGAFHDDVVTGGQHGGILQSTISGPGWATAMTGFWADGHGVETNSNAVGNELERMHVFDLIKLAYPSASAAVVADWTNLTTNLAPERADVLHQNAAKDSDEATERVLAWLDWDVAPTAVFYYLHNVDIHSDAYDPDNAYYQGVIEYEDAQIGEVMDGITARISNFPEEEWLIVVTSDHGGLGDGHGGQSDEERRTFLILNSSFARPDLPAYCAGPLDGAMDQVDGVTPHVTDFLDITLPYQLDGEVNSACL